jgi:drug/metabolite transporter superfamily protein YnfA
MPLRVRAAMPPDPEPPRRVRGWSLAAMPLAGLALYLLARTPFEAQYPTGYAAYRHPGSWTYPTGEVEVCMTIMLLEALAIFAVLAARTTMSLGGRTFVLAGGMFVLLFPASIFAMHCDGTIGNLLAWQFLATAWLLAFSLGRALVAIVRKLAA